MSRSLTILLACLLVFTFLIALDATSIILSIFSITEDLDGDATESFWIGASYLLAMCISQPILSCLSQLYGGKNIILTSAVLLGVGSLISGDSETMAFLLLGRTIQGLGAGGLTVLSYVTYGHLESSTGHRYLAGMSLSMALGTICGPILGSALSRSGDWRWLFQLNIPCCLILGALLYSTTDAIYEADSTLTTLASLDLIAAVLSIASIVPLLAGLSLAGSVYDWSDWQIIALIASGCFCLILFIAREAHPALFWLPGRKLSGRAKPFLGLRSLGKMQVLDVCIGAMLLGVLMYALLFFLPVYYRVIKGHSAMTTDLLLLSQTLMLAPCGGVVFGLVEKLGYQVQWLIVIGWLCASCGFGLLTMLNAETSVAIEVLLNLLSGFGIGILLPALAISAKGSVDSQPQRQLRQPTSVLVYMRYLGSATGLVVMGLVFQRVLQRNLALTLPADEARALVKHATTLVYSIQAMPRSDRKLVFIQATQSTLRTIWAILSIASAILFLLCCVKVVITASKERDRASSSSVIRSGSALDPPPRTETHKGDRLWSDAFPLRYLEDEAVDKETGPKL